MDAKETLELEIYTQNELNELLFNEVCFILPQIKKFLDKKIFIATGRSKLFVINFTNRKPKPYKKGFAQVVGCYLTNPYNKLQLVYRLCFNGGSYDTKPVTAYTKYVDKHISLGDLSTTDILKNVFDIDTIIAENGLKDELNIKTELQHIAEYKKHKAEADQAKRKINVGEEFYKYL